MLLASHSVNLTLTGPLIDVLKLGGLQFTVIQLPSQNTNHHSLYPPAGSESLTFLREIILARDNTQNV